MTEHYHISLDVDVNDRQAGQKMQKRIEQLERLQKGAQRAKTAADRLANTRFEKMAGGLDRASRAFDKFRDHAVLAMRRVQSVMAAGVGKLRGLWGSLTSLPAMLGLGGAGYAAKSLIFDPAAQYEGQIVSMRHWLKGNEQQVKDAVSWVEKFGAATPFTGAELFPALARGIGVEDGDLAKAKQLVMIAGDMAALTPGKTMIDAMEAIADAKMGEFERLKEFSVKILKKDVRTWDDVTKLLGKKFAGGAEAYSKTTLGMISTIQDNVETLLRTLGTGFLDGMRPLLQRVTEWFAQNEATIERWKEHAMRWGREAAEGIGKAFEGVQAWFKPLFDSEAFKNADFGDKFIMIFDKGLEGLEQWANDKKTSERIEKVLGRIIGLGVSGYTKLLKATVLGIGDAAGKGNWLQALIFGLFANKLTGGIVPKMLAGLWGKLFPAAMAGGGAAAAGGAARAGGSFLGNMLWGGGLSGFAGWALRPLGNLGIKGLGALGPQVAGGGILSLPAVIWAMIAKHYKEGEISAYDAAIAAGGGSIQQRMGRRYDTQRNAFYGQVKARGVEAPELLRRAAEAGYGPTKANQSDRYFKAVQWLHDLDAGKIDRVGKTFEKTQQAMVQAVNDNGPAMVAAHRRWLAQLSAPPGAMMQLPGISPLPGKPVPKFGDGGIITRPTLGLLAEKGEPEAVIPLSKLAGAGGGSVTINVNGARDPESVAREIVRQLQRVWENTP